MIILITPKGWTGPKEIEGSFKSHQIPFAVNEDNLDDLYANRLSDWSDIDSYSNSD